METEERNPTRRCVTCGKLMEAETYDDLWIVYTNHQVREHGKPVSKHDVE